MRKKSPQNKEKFQQPGNYTLVFSNVNLCNVTIKWDENEELEFCLIVEFNH